MTGPRWRLLAPLVLLAAAVVVAAALAGPGDHGPPLDPRSTGPDGTKALVDTLEEIGADVRVARAPGPDDDVALLLADGRSDAERAELEAWVDAGGLLVVADPASPLTPEPVGSPALGLLPATLPRSCGLAALEDVGEVLVGAGGRTYAVPVGSHGCFPDGDGHWLVVTPRGEGLLVALGGPGTLTNAALGEGDHAVLAAALLAPRRGTRTAVLRPALPGEGEASATSLIGPAVRAGLWQLLVAFLLLAAWRGRRLGRPLEQPEPERIPGSELVVAVGTLLQRTGSVARAAALVRHSVLDAVRERLGLPPGAPDEQVAEVVAQRTGMDPEGARHVLAGPPPADEEALVALARSAERLRSAAIGREGEHGDD